MSSKLQEKYVNYNGKKNMVVGAAKNALTGETLVLYKEDDSNEVLAMPESVWKPMMEYIEKYEDSTRLNKETSKEDTTKRINRFYNNYIELFGMISEYLFEVTPSNITKEQLAEYDHSELLNSMNKLCIVFFSTIQDYQFMPNVIGFNNPERRESFRKILFDFDHLKILENYDEESLFESFCDAFPVKNKESRSNSWRRYAKGILSICSYLTRFKNIQEFNEYCSGFHGDITLPDEMSREIIGMGFPLACNLIKDIGFNDYCKPDVHLKDVLAGTGYCNDDDRSVFDCVRAIASANDINAHAVDSRIWLICSGYYYKHNVSIPSHKKELIEKINEMNNNQGRDMIWI